MSGEPSSSSISSALPWSATMTQAPQHQAPQERSGPDGHPCPEEEGGSGSGGSGGSGASPGAGTSGDDTVAY